MSKAFIAAAIQHSIGCNGETADAAAANLIAAVIQQMKREGRFILLGFGTFRVAKTEARKARNPRTGEPIKVKAGKTVRFKASPRLKKTV